jgi:hypothetical protein
MLTEQELELTEKLGECWNLFLKTEDTHESEKIDFMNAIHKAQQIVMARSAVRCHPEMFKQKIN